LVELVVFLVVLWVSTSEVEWTA